MLILFPLTLIPNPTGLPSGVTRGISRASLVLVEATGAVGKDMGSSGAGSDSGGSSEAVRCRVRVT